MGFRQRCGCSGLASCQVGVVLVQNVAYPSLCQAGQVIIAVRDPAVGEQGHSFQRAFSYIGTILYNRIAVPIIIKAFCGVVNYSGDRITHPGQSVVGIVLIRHPQLCRTSCLARANQAAYGIIVVGIPNRTANIPNIAIINKFTWHSRKHTIPVGQTACTYSEPLRCHIAPRASHSA